jgi:DNA topoisomerase IB
MKTITVTFNGEAVTIETSGFTGSSCKVETADLKAALGLTDVEETPTREAFATIDAREKEVRRGR